MGPKPDYQLPEHAAASEKWELVDDCDSGQQAVDAKGDKYLPRPNPTDKTPLNQARYESYLARAVFANFTQKTLSGLCGEIFAQDAVVELPEILTPLIDDVDDAGVTLDQQMRKTVRRLIKYGRQPLYVDYPQTEGVASRADIASGAIRPSIIGYDPRQVINWRTVKVGNAVKLGLVVIAEVGREIDPDNEFKQIERPQWRVLRLAMDDGAEPYYQREIWIKEKDAQGVESFVILEDSQVIPTKSDGKRWSEIPFIFAGAANNDPDIDLSPAYDLAVLNIAHRRNSADYEESCFIVGQPTVHIDMGELTDEQFKEANPEGILFGSCRSIQTKGGGLNMVQAAPNSMPFEAMEKKERQMIALGAKLIEDKSVQRTAYQAGIERSSETSTLATIAQNASSAYRQCLLWAWQFVAAPQADEEKIALALNDDFSTIALDAQTLAGVVAGWQAGAISRPAMWRRLTEWGIEEEDFEDYKDLIDGDPAGLPMGGSGNSNLEEDADNGA